MLTRPMRVLVFYLGSFLHTHSIKEEMSLEAWGKWAGNRTTFLTIGTVSSGVVDYQGTRLPIITGK